MSPERCSGRDSVKDSDLSDASVVSWHHHHHQEFTLTALLMFVGGVSPCFPA